MLVIGRKHDEAVVIDERITVRVVRVDGGKVKLGITAPADVPIVRGELQERAQGAAEDDVLAAQAADKQPGL